MTQREINYSHIDGVTPLTPPSFAALLALTKPTSMQLLLTPHPIAPYMHSNTHSDYTTASTACPATAVAWWEV